MSSANSRILKWSKEHPLFKKVFLYYNLYIRNLKFFFKSSQSQLGEDKKIINQVGLAEYNTTIEFVRNNDYKNKGVPFSNSNVKYLYCVSKYPTNLADIIGKVMNIRTLKI